MSTLAKEDAMLLRAITDRTDVSSAEGIEDVLRFDVCTGADREKIGEVDGILIDDSERTRFLSIGLDDEQRRILLPASMASIDPEHRTVWIAGMRRDRVPEIPSYAGDPIKINTDYEARVEAAYENARTENLSGWPDLDTPRVAGGTEHRVIERVDRLDDVVVARGQIDPRGWVVVGGDGTELGRIEHLLGDVDSMRVVYLVMAVDEHRAGGARDVLIPIERAHLDPDTRRAYVDALDGRRIAVLPAFDGPLDADDVYAVETLYDVFRLEADIAARGGGR